MPLVALLFVILGVVLFGVAGYLMRDLYLRLLAWGLAITTIGFALYFLLPDADKVHF
jgi:hypothetical protein